MLELKQIAVTGGISCGKSQFCLYLKKLGAYVVSADKIVHQLLSHQTDLGKKVTQLLGPEIIKEGKLDRSAIAKKVFRDAKLLNNLENITHPQVFLEIEKKYKKCREKGNYPLFIVEIPLLFEVGAENRFDTTIAVLADESTCMNRFTETTGLNEQEYHLRMERQLSSKEKAARADIVACNDRSLKDLKAEAEKIFTQLTTT